MNFLCSKHHGFQVVKTSTLLSKVAGSILLCLGSMLWSSQLIAQDSTFPTKSIKIIVPFTPGGPTDLIARVVSQALQKAFTQTVIVENKPGAGGAIGTRFVAQSEPNGLTLLLGTVATLGSLPAVQKSAGYDPVKSFAPIAKVTESNTVLVASIDAPFKSIAELVAYARANPGKINYASAGIGNQTQLNAELFKARTKTSLQHIPYKSGNEMLTAVLSKDAQLAFLDMSFVLPYIRENKLIALAVTGKTRHPKLAEIATMVEAGVPDFSASFWTGILAPAGTPVAIVNKLNAAINSGIASPELRAMLTNISAEPTLQTPQEFGAFIESEHLKWRELVRSAGISEE
jgi:tripartite-type tricarboxylate transporter receptor subunit TctC